MARTPLVYGDQAGEVKAPKLAEIIAQRLRLKIVRGELQGGDPLPSEATLSETLKASRPTVREAYRILESENLVAIKRGVGGGPRVQIPSTDMAARYVSLVLEHRETTVADVYQAREVIEVEAARILAGKRTNADLKALRQRHDEIGASVPGHPLRFSENSLTFHQLIVELAGNQTLAVLNALGNQIIVRANRQHTMAALEPGSTREFDIGEAQEDHARVIELIEQRDVEEVGAHWRAHDRQFAQRALQQRGEATVLDILDDMADSR